MLQTKVTPPSADMGDAQHRSEGRVNLVVPTANDGGVMDGVGENLQEKFTREKIVD
jgi:hypothetical protein